MICVTDCVTERVMKKTFIYRVVRFAYDGETETLGVYKTLGRARARLKEAGKSFEDECGEEPTSISEDEIRFDDPDCGYNYSFHIDKEKVK